MASPDTKSQIKRITKPSRLGGLARENSSVVSGYEKISPLRNCRTLMMLTAALTPKRIPKFGRIENNPTPLQRTSRNPSIDQ
jgi:hypothetical protein